MWLVLQPLKHDTDTIPSAVLWLWEYCCSYDGLSFSPLQGQVEEEGEEGEGVGPEEVEPEVVEGERNEQIHTNLSPVIFQVLYGFMIIMRVQILCIQNMHV